MQYLKQLYQLFKPSPTGGLLPGSAARRSATVSHRRFVAAPQDHLHPLSQQHRDAGNARRPGRTRHENLLSNQVEGVVVLFAVEPLVVQGPEGPFSDAVMARSLDPGADVRNWSISREVPFDQVGAPCQVGSRHGSCGPWGGADTPSRPSRLHEPAHRPSGLVATPPAFQDFVDPPLAGGFVRSR